MTFDPGSVAPAVVGAPDMTRIVLLIGALLIVAMISPKMRVKTLVPIACILLGLALSGDGVVNTLENAVRDVGGFLRSLPVDFLKE